MPGSSGRLTMRSLAEGISLTTGGVTRLVDRMEAAEYVEQVPCPTGRRVCCPSLTDRGRAKLDEAAQIREANLRSVLADFSDEDRNTPDALLDRLRSVREASRSNASVSTRSEERRVGKECRYRWS